MYIYKNKTSGKIYVEKKYEIFSNEALIFFSSESSGSPTF